MTRTMLTGSYRILNQTHLERKAGRRTDPRYVFYISLLRNSSYEGYLAEVGSRLVDVPGFKNSPVSGRAEILYCRRNGWIEDAA
ncbi:hypothetical protein ABGN05_19115 [Aquibium sp. LZ166]|uniref:Uncharacterized protein n=1 Tax=Aquibium pacificus TaxID=3153579 RepID=A0ABV3SLV8_9HYPH